MENLELNSNSIFQQDLQLIFNGLTDSEKLKFYDASILITGCAGFLGFYLLNFFSNFKEKLHIKSIIGLDNFISGYPNWLKKIEEKKTISFYKFNIVTDKLEEIPNFIDFDYVIHMASIASPTFYRKFPLETIDANIWGLRYLLDYFAQRRIKGFLFFSSSEIYGNPDPQFIPTSENYPGLVSSQGPRACYDEAKRFGETLCYVFNQKYNLPITIIRPFNNFGPGMKLNDARAPADFAHSIISGKNITLFSDGQPTRTFCYITDAITGYLKGLLHSKFETFNIGNPKPEITIIELANLFKKHGQDIFGYQGTVHYEKSQDVNYLVNNPLRRCPSIDKAHMLLGYQPQIQVDEGVKRFLQFLSESKREDLIW